MELVIEEMMVMSNSAELAQMARAGKSITVQVCNGTPVTLTLMSCELGSEPMMRARYVNRNAIDHLSKSAVPSHTHLRSKTVQPFIEVVTDKWRKEIERLHTSTDVFFVQDGNYRKATDKECQNAQWIAVVCENKKPKSILILEDVSELLEAKRCAGMGKSAVPSHTLKQQYDALKAALRKATRSLELAGFTDNGGELWKPPLGKPAVPLHTLELEERIDLLNTMVDKWELLYSKAMKIMHEQKARIAKLEKPAVPSHVDERRAQFEQYVLSALKYPGLSRVPNDYPIAELRGEYLSTHVTTMWGMWNQICDHLSVKNKS